METTNTQRNYTQMDSDQVVQEHNSRLREIRKKQKEELDSLAEAHERNMKQAESAYKVELSGKTEEFQRKLSELDESQQNRLASTAKANDMTLAQARATYRAQADELRSQGERKINMIREQQAESMQNLNRKGNA